PVPGQSSLLRLQLATETEPFSACRRLSADQLLYFHWEFHNPDRLAGARVATGPAALLVHGDQVEGPAGVLHGNAEPALDEFPQQPPALFPPVGDVAEYRFITSPVAQALEPPLFLEGLSQLPPPRFQLPVVVGVNRQAPHRFLDADQFAPGVT